MSQLGDNGAAAPEALTPVTIGFSGSPLITQVAAGNATGYALDSAGHVWAWGSNTFGQVGNGNTVSPVGTPTQISFGGALINKIVAGYTFAFAVDTAGHLWSWGNNSEGELGLSSAAGHIASPTQLAGLAAVTSVAAGQGASGDQALAVGQDPAHPELGSALWAWGPTAPGN